MNHSHIPMFQVCYEASFKLAFLKSKNSSLLLFCPKLKSKAMTSNEQNSYSNRNLTMKRFSTIVFSRKLCIKQKDSCHIYYFELQMNS